MNPYYHVVSSRIMVNECRGLHSIKISEITIITVLKTCKFLDGHDNVFLRRKKGTCKLLTNDHHAVHAKRYDLCLLFYCCPFKIKMKKKENLFVFPFVCFILLGE